MPPKKKEEQIDLSTLPQCKTLNIFLFCKGKQDRAKKILSKIDAKLDKMGNHVKKSAVLDYAKEKGIYVDPQSLTDKQKKDPKFMQTVCTQMTPQVLAKATDAYINNLNVKIRLEKKGLLDKPQTAQAEKNKKIDCLYIFDDFPTETADFQALSAANQGIKFVLVISPKISWASAPQQPQPASPDQQPQEPDQEYVAYLKLKQSETMTVQDTEYEAQIDQKIDRIGAQRKKSARTSPFRDTVIEYVKCTVDPYTQDASIDEIVAAVIPTCEQLQVSYEDFKNWGKQRATQKLPQIQDEKLKLKEAAIKSQRKQTDNTMNIIDRLIKTFQPNSEEGRSKQEEIDFSNFDFNSIGVYQPPSPPRHSFSSDKSVAANQYLSYNEQKQKEERQYYKDILKHLRYPGIDRYAMPEVPTKSQGVRKQYRSSFGQFLPANLSFQDFEHKSSILFLESMSKQSDEERTYDFSNKIYEEQHTKQSLQRELNKCLTFDQSLPVIKYNENNDKLYLCLLYKNPVRRMYKKIWESNWKVLPNFENWIKYFKDNQNNIGNTSFYDIDYQNIGNVQEDANVWALDAGVVVRKRATVAGKVNTMLYALTGNNTGDLIFGIRNKNNLPQFYANNESASIIQTTTIKHTTQNDKEQKQKSILLTFKDSSIIEFKQNGDILVRKPKETPRLITRNGYTILYKSDNNRTILHPNGSISNPPSKFVNCSGRGMSNGKLHEVSTLRRITEQGQVIIKRDDQTVIVQEGQKKWIKFEDHTQYMEQSQQILIQKEGYPTFTVLNDQKIVMNYNGVNVESWKTESGYEYKFKFTRLSVNNDSQILFKPTHIQIFDGKTQTPYMCTLTQSQTEMPSISKQWKQEKLEISFNSSKYKRNQKEIVDPEQDEQNYNQLDVQRPEYLEPRVFIINNDNTGIELLSEQQLKFGYFDAFQKEQGVNGVKRSELREVKHQEIKNKSVVHGVIPIPSLNDLNKKNIKQIQIKLDVFNNKKQDLQDEIEEHNSLQVRSIIKHEPLSKEDRNLIADILKRRAQHQSKSEREDNQYGFKPKSDPSTLERFESKKKTIEFRKLKEQPVLSQLLKNEAIQLYNNETYSRLKKIENENRELQLRKRLSKKKSYVPQYNWKQPPVMEIDENLQFYNPQKSFYTDYFETAQGKKALSQMPDWVFRPKQNKKPQQLDPQIRSQLNATMNKTKKQQQLMNATNQKLSLKEQSERNQRYDTVQPELKPSPIIYIKPSVFTQRQIDEERFAFETEKKAYEYHERKRKDFDVYGRDRKDKVDVPSLMRTQPVSELNQKYLVTEAPVDKKVKISSMKNKLTSQASNMTEMRKQGPHANLIRTIDKGNDYSKLLEKRTMMVQADLNDRLQRDIQINPIQANFGLVKQGGNYEMKIQIKNEDVLAQRIHLKKPKSIFCKVQMVEMGPIALGMTRKISVILKAAPQISGKFTDEFDIVTKHEIYHIPISAQIVSKNQFEMSGTVLSKSIRQFEQIGKKKREQLPPIKQ